MLNHLSRKVQIGYPVDYRVGLGFPIVQDSNGGLRKLQFILKIKSPTSLGRNLNIYIIHIDKISQKYQALLRLQ